MPLELEGSWTNGCAYDLHTVSSVHLGVDEFGHDRFDNTRSEMGELLYKLKYGSDLSVIGKIIQLLDVIGGIETLDVIIPVPSSKRNRPFQPVDEIAKALGKHRGVTVLPGYLEKQGTEQELKSVNDPDERVRLLTGAIRIVGKENISGSRVLLVDDLYRSGATLEACSNVLFQQAEIAELCVLTMTKTRSKR